MTRLVDKILTWRERAVLSLRFGINDPEHTMGEVARVFKITRERVRQIEKKACKKLLTIAFKEEAK